MSPDADVRDAVEAIWRANRGEMARRIATLEEAIRALRCDVLDDELRARAICDAHKLAGALGMFDLATGSELSRELEQSLQAAAGPLPGELARLTELVLALRFEFENRTSARQVADLTPSHPPTSKVMP
jgi:HPt (histidine-containing phosphotransfer) domain-containing protein